MFRHERDLREGEPYVPDEDDPDYRFSEAAGYGEWEPPRRPWLRPLMVGMAVLLVLAFLGPLVLRMVAVLE